MIAGDIVFVFAIAANPETYSHPERYFSETVLRKLKYSYEFDCEDNDCYASYELRTKVQDSKPGTDGKSSINKMRVSTMVGISSDTQIWVGQG